MRLSERYIEVIKKYFKVFSENGEIYLFCSRVDDSKKGGDIDLYLEVKDHSNLLRENLNF